MGTLRLLLALSVVAGHTSAIRWLPLPTGTIAVQIFFVISGFYMALILNEKYLGAGSYRLFITNRFVRIYPVYFLMAGLTLILALSLHTEIKLFDPERLRELGGGAKTLVFAANLAIFGLDSFDFMAIENGSFHVVRELVGHPLLPDHMKLVPQAWSLSTELSFYVIAPFIVRHIRRIWAIGLLSVGLRFVLWQGGFDTGAWIYEFFPTELAFFLLGALLYHAQRTQSFQRWGVMLAPFAVFATGLALFTYNDLPVVLSFTLVAASIPLLFLLTKHNPFDRLVGELSYPVYMVHFFIIYAARALAPEFAHSGRFSSVCAALSLILGFGIYWRVVLPIDRWRDQRTEEAKREISSQPIVAPTNLPIAPLPH